MNPQAFSEWLETLSSSKRIIALTLVYSFMTVGTRELFLPEWAGKEKRAVDLLQGINEIHHTLANQLIEYVTDGKYAYSIEGFSQQLMEIANQYRIVSLLESAIEFARTRDCLR